MIKFSTRFLSNMLGNIATIKPNIKNKIDKKIKTILKVNIPNSITNKYSLKESGKTIHQITLNENIEEKTISYTREELINLTKKMSLKEEHFVFDLQKNPSTSYSKFYNNQFDASHNKEIILRIIGDINCRLNSEVLKAKLFESYKENLEEIRNEGIKLLSQHNADLLTLRKKEKFNFINPSELYSFVLSYIELMYKLLKSQGNEKEHTYYTDFAKDFIKNLSVPGNNSQLFFTFENLDEQYFIDVRPLCLYPVHLMSLPDFSSSSSLIPTTQTKGYIEGKLLDFREVTYHDIGHAHVMNRQDKWLFETSNNSPKELVTEWIRNKEWYMNECNKVKETDYSLYKAIKLFLFDITHERGYQFYFPIIKQQLKALKNLENLKARIMRGEFDTNYDRNIINYLGEARQWLLDLTEEFLIKDNIDKIEKYKKMGYIIKKYPDVESCNGVPTNVTICKNGKILVDFDSNGITKTTSLYEIELISLPVEEVILSDEKITKINTSIDSFKYSSDEFIHLTNEADPLYTAQNSKPENTKVNQEKHLKKIEIFKLERLLQLIKHKKIVKFSISKLPEIHESVDIRINEEKRNVTIDTGLFFKLNEISIESKPRTTLKYVNLEPQDRFVSEKILRDSYIRSSSSKNLQMNPYVTLNNEFELGIIDTKKHVEMAKAVSSLLSRSIDRAKDIYGGYLPTKIVERAQLEYVSPYALSHLWGSSSYRFVLSRKINSFTKEIIGTALITNNEDTLLFFTNKYNNLKFSKIKEEVDFDLRVDGQHRWFDKFEMPEIENYKPQGCHQLANFAVEITKCRGTGLGKLFINEIIKNYAVNYPTVNIQHSQPLIQGKGLFQIADPSWRKYMLNIGFKHRYGAETFYIDQKWDKLTPVYMNGKEIDNISYNQLYEIPQIYENINLEHINTDMDLKKRIPRVIKLANSGNAKLQYFQMIYMF